MVRRRTLLGGLCAASLAGCLGEGSDDAAIYRAGIYWSVTRDEFALSETTRLTDEGGVLDVYDPETFIRVNGERTESRRIERGQTVEYVYDSDRFLADPVTTFAYTVPEDDSIRDVMVGFAVVRRTDDDRWTVERRDAEATGALDPSAVLAVSRRPIESDGRQWWVWTPSGESREDVADAVREAHDEPADITWLANEETVSFTPESGYAGRVSMFHVTGSRADGKGDVGRLYDENPELFFASVPKS